ncbi:MAG TPA: flagellar basal body-associated FliL family protein [Bacillota bacterium]|nr:flagellar basal body-associated FliL family protein [Bacillota bacterium]
MAEESKVVAKNISANPNPNQMLTYIILGLIALLIIILVGAMYILFKFKFPKVVNVPVVQQQQQQVVNGGGSSEKFGELVPLNEVLTNLAASADGIHYLKMNVTLEVIEDEKVKADLEKRVPQFRDLINSIIGSKTLEMIQEEKGKEELKREILDKLNSVVGMGKIKNIYFQDFMLQ